MTRLSYTAPQFKVRADRFKDKEIYEVVKGLAFDLRVFQKDVASALNAIATHVWMNQARSTAGAVTLTGANFQPRDVTVLATLHNDTEMLWSVGWSDATSLCCIKAVDRVGGNLMQASATQLAMIDDNNNVDWIAITGLAMTSDGCTLTFTGGGTLPTMTFHVIARG